MIRVGILTISDSAFSGMRADASGPALAECCRERKWEVAQTAVVPDEQSAISAKLIEWSDVAGTPIILTTGGTGVALRDVTPEATRAVIHREIPGMSELMRAKGLEQTVFSVLSRAVVGTRNRTLIINLPGSPRGALFSLQVIEPLMTHVVDLLQGRTEHPCHP